MKMRNGFVSNSSSASYIVKIRDITMEELADTFRVGYNYGDYNLNTIEETLAGRIDLLTKDKEGCDKANPSTAWYESQLAKYQGFLNELKSLQSNNTDENNTKVMEFLLDYYDVTWEEGNWGLKLSAFTSMHNDFNEGMVGILKEIVLFLTFTGRYKMDCEKIDG